MNKYIYIDSKFKLSGTNSNFEIFTSQTKDWNLPTSYETQHFCFVKIETVYILYNNINVEPLLKVEFFENTTRDTNKVFNLNNEKQTCFVAHITSETTNNAMERLYKSETIQSIRLPAQSSYSLKIKNIDDELIDCERVLICIRLTSI